MEEKFNEKAIRLVREYAKKHLDKSDGIINF